MGKKVYFQFTTRARLDKAINTLLGILEGIAADQTINKAEMELLTQWVKDNQSLVDRHPYNELIPSIIQALADGRFTQEEQKNLTWLCTQLRSTEFYDLATSDIQRLQGVMTAIAADGIITETEVESLRSWLSTHEDLRTCWPYDELDSLLADVLKDHRIDPEEHGRLLDYFNSFSSAGTSVETPRSPTKTLPGICAIDPAIAFEDRRFCFTGESSRTRDEMQILVTSRGGIVLADVSPKLDFLIVGSKGNPCWAYACYGRKIEKVMQLRQNGAHILIVHENDFFDATQ